MSVEKMRLAGTQKHLTLEVYIEYRLDRLGCLSCLLYTSLAHTFTLRLQPSPYHGTPTQLIIYPRLYDSTRSARLPATGSSTSRERHPP